MDKFAQLLECHLVKTIKSLIALDEITDQKESQLKQKYNLSDEHMGHVKSSDPTPNHEYAHWIAMHSHKGNIRLPEDGTKLHSQLSTFHKLKKSPAFTGKKDIGQHTPASLYQTIHDNAHESSKKSDTKDMGEPIAVDGDYKVHRISSQHMGHENAVKALMNASSGTNWCTAHKEHADDYLKKGPSYVMFHKGSRHSQLHPKTDSFLDRHDQRIDRHHDVHAERLLKLGSSKNSDIEKYHDRIGRIHHTTDKDDKLHSEHDKPSLIDPSLYFPSHKAWHHHGELHREHGPALEDGDGAKHWYQHGKLHREDRPAIEHANGDTEWYRHGERHRDGGPARVVSDKFKSWFRHGKLHRDDGPAREFPNRKNEYWKDGVQYNPGT